MNSWTHWLRHRNFPPARIWAHIRGHYWSAKIDDISLHPRPLVMRFKDIVSRDDTRVLKSNQYFLYQCWWFLQYVAAFLWRKLKIMLWHVHWRKLNNDSMTAKENRNSDVAFRTIFRICNCFQRSKERLNNYYIFLFHMSSKRGGVYLPSQLERIYHNLVLDGRYSERRWACTPPPPPPPSLGWADFSIMMECTP